jgi:transposase
LLRGSFVPNEQIRQWRDLTRQRTKLLDQRTSVINRIHKTLESYNIKLGAVASDVMGVSGRAMLQALSEGEQDAEKLAGMARGRLKSKYEELVESLERRVSEHHLLNNPIKPAANGGIGEFYFPSAHKSGRLPRRNIWK